MCLWIHTFLYPFINPSVSGAFQSGFQTSEKFSLNASACIRLNVVQYLLPFYKICMQWKAKILCSFSEFWQMCTLMNTWTPLKIQNIELQIILRKKRNMWCKLSFLWKKSKILRNFKVKQAIPFFPLTSINFFNSITATK